MFECLSPSEELYSEPAGTYILFSDDVTGYDCVTVSPYLNCVSSSYMLVLTLLKDNLVLLFSIKE